MGTLRSDFRPGMLDGPAAREVRRAGDEWVKTSRRHAPIKTKRLHNGIRVRPSGPKEVETRSEAEYSKFVDEGHNTTGGRVRNTAIRITVESRSPDSAKVDAGTRRVPAQPFWLPGRQAAVRYLEQARLDP